jgi:hypothetical protein
MLWPISVSAYPAFRVELGDERAGINMLGGPGGTGLGSAARYGVSMSAVELTIRPQPPPGRSLGPAQPGALRAVVK